jgi:hypothetical protein
MPPYICFCICRTQHLSIMRPVVMIVQPIHEVHQTHSGFTHAGFAVNATSETDDFKFIFQKGTRGSIVGSGTMLQAGRSRF